MTVLRHIPSQLILAHAPWTLGVGLIMCVLICAAIALALLSAGETSGLVTALLGACLPLAIFALAIRRDQAIFDARASTVTLQRRTIRGYVQREHPLDAVRGVEIESIADTARPVLVFQDCTSSYPLVEAFLSGNAPRKTAQTVNDWLRACRRGSNL